MRKLLTSIIAIVMAISMFVLSGCNLVVTNDEKDMNQVIATIQISEDAPMDEVYKKDLVMAYLNYGYYYEQNGQTREQVIDLIMNNLTVTRVFVQNAITQFDAGEGIFANQIEDTSITDKWNLDRYLSEEDLVNAEYEAKKAISDLIDNYEEKEDEKLGDTITDEIRTAPTGAANEEKEVTETEKKNFKIDVNSTSKRRTAFNKVLRLLENNSLLGDYVNDVTETDYYEKMLKGQKEQEIIEKYQTCIYKSVHGNYSFSNVEELFETKLSEQQEWNDAEYFEALSNASAKSPILYAPTGTYGFVYNLLLGISDEQTKEFNEWKAEHKNALTEEVNQARREIFAKTTAKDLRSTWISSGYDFNGTHFIGDYTMLPNTDASLAFQGTVKHLNSDEIGNEDYREEYGVTSVTEFSLDEIIALIETYIYGAPAIDNVGYMDPSVLKAFNTSAALPDYEKRVNELLFAFSTDPGSLNTYKGYAISPIPDGANNETYKDEFAVYGRELLKMGDKSYMIVATDYGYHVLFYSECYTGGTVYNTLKDYLNGECSNLLEAGQTWEEYFAKMQEDWSEFEDTDNYLYALYNELVANPLNIAVNEKDNELLNQYVYGENSKIVKYEERYANWLK